MSSIRQLTVRPGLAGVAMTLAICAIGISAGVYVLVSLPRTGDWQFVFMITGAILLLITWPLVGLCNLIRSTIRVTDKELIATQSWLVRPENKRSVRRTLFAYTRTIKLAEVAKGSLTLIPYGRSPVPVVTLTMHDGSKHTIWLGAYAERSMIELADALELGGVSMFRYAAFKKRKTSA